MEKFINEVDIVKSTDYYTPSSLAFDMIVGNIDKSKAGELVEYSPEEISKCDILTYRYELLLTIFMEMFFYLAKIDHYETNEDIEYVPKYDNINLNMYMEKISENFEILGYTAIIETDNLDKFASDKEALNFLVKNRYCRIILQNYDNDMELYNLTGDTFYHMKLNGLNEIKYEELSQIYSLIFINEMVICIKFIKN